jgi:hypothetical protein
MLNVGNCIDLFNRVGRNSILLAYQGTVSAVPQEAPFAIRDFSP